MKNLENLVDGPILAGGLVTAKGRAKAVMGGALAGAVGGSVLKAGAQTLAEHSNQEASPLPPSAFKLAYLAVTAKEIVLVEGKPGLVGTKATSVAATAPRASFVSGAIGGGTMAKALTLNFAGDVTWELEVPRANVKEIEGVLKELGAN